MYAFVIALAMCFLLAWPLYQVLAKRGIVDKPNERSSHALPTVRGGGIAIIVTLIGVTGWLLHRFELQPMLMVGLSMTGLAVVSFLDDLKSIRVAIRLGWHLLAAIIVVVTLGVSSTTFGLSPGAGIVVPAIVGSVLAVVWVLGYTNAFNFMDGINGIAAGQAAITGLGMALLAGLASGSFVNAPVLLSLAVAGAALGFLPYNFPQARIFMGDVGSAPLGFLLGVLVIWLAHTAGDWLLIPLALLHANFVLDTFITLGRRVAWGDKWHQAHREHFYQRLVRSGKSHAFVTGWEMGLQCFVLGLMVIYLHASVPVRVGLIGGVVLTWLAFFACCEFAFHRHVCRLPAAAQRLPGLPADL